MRITEAARAAALALAAALAIAGCREADEGPRSARRAMTLADLPAAAREAAGAALPGVKLEDCWANVDADGATLSYEVRGRAANGKTREVRVAPDGAVLELE